MANTYTLIASNVLGSAAASVTFSSIPATYTDLVLRVSARSTYGFPRDYCQIQFNGSTSNLYSHTMLEGFDGSGTSERGNGSEITQFGVPGNTTTANTFGLLEIYIPSYTASINKIVSISGVTENNSTTGAETKALAGLWRNTATITSILFASNNASLVAGSSFYLYGIKNS
jgi:hypothetical protein